MTNTSVRYITLLSFYLLSFFTYGSLNAQEYTGMIESNKEDRQSSNSNSQHLGIFIRLGAVIGSGTIFDEYNRSSLSFPYSYSDNIVQDDMSSKGVVASIGMKLKQGKSSGTQIIAVIKSGYDSTESEDSLSYTQFGSALELYLGSKKVQFLLGTLFSIGSADHLSGKLEDIYYMALEPYVGLDYSFSRDFSILTKVGYEWRDYEQASYKDVTSSYSTKLTSFTLTGSLILQYSF